MPDLLVLLAQVAGILVAARVVGWVMGRIGQPQVVGEMLAGIVLGPSVFGWLAPEWFHAAFPPASFGFLSVLSNIGLLFFMFLVGLDLDLTLLRGRGRAAVVTSHASIVAPFLLGAVLALVLYPRLSDSSVPFTGFALFLAAAMSVTAFPVLARMLAEGGMLKTRLGSVAIAAAAVDDVSAWCILAVVIAVVRAAEAPIPLPVMLAGVVAYALVMLTIGRRALRWLEHVVKRQGGVSQDLFAVVLLIVIASAWITERLGVHSVFGAFLAGVAMPRDEDVVGPVRERLHDLMVTLFLPLFFAFTGLRTSIGLIRGELWIYCGLIIGAAIAGKMGGSALAARFTGMSWRESWAIGTLMNTRGLMELVILNVGLDMGVISPALFAMLVLMAIFTTCLTTPMLARLYPSHLFGPETPAPETALS